MLINPIQSCFIEKSGCFHKYWALPTRHGIRSYIASSASSSERVSKPCSSGARANMQTSKATRQGTMSSITSLGHDLPLTQAMEQAYQLTLIPSARSISNWEVAAVPHQVHQTNGTTPNLQGEDCRLRILTVVLAQFRPPPP